MYSLLEYSNNYAMTSASLSNYYANVNENNAAVNCRINNNKITTRKSFEYKTKIIWSTPANNSGLDTVAVVPLKYLSKFWRSLDLPLINCDVELHLRSAKSCGISEISRTNAVTEETPVEATTTTSTKFQIKMPN